jgi:hypothetical protein
METRFFRRKRRGCHRVEDSHAFRLDPDGYRHNRGKCRSSYCGRLSKLLISADTFSDNLTEIQQVTSPINADGGFVLLEFVLAR